MTDKIYKMRYLSKINAHNETDKIIQVSLVDADHDYEDSLTFDFIKPLWESKKISCKNGGDYDVLLEWYRVSWIVMQCNAVKTSDATLLYLLNN